MNHDNNAHISCLLCVFGDPEGGVATTKPGGRGRTRNSIVGRGTSSTSRRTSIDLSKSGYYGAKDTVIVSLYYLRWNLFVGFRAPNLLRRRSSTPEFFWPGGNILLSGRLADQPRRFGRRRYNHSIISMYPAYTPTYSLYIPYITPYPCIFPLYPLNNPTYPYMFPIYSLYNPYTPIHSLHIPLAHPRHPMLQASMQICASRGTHD